VTAPLRIGILGAARIADDGIVAPARALGHELAAVAARDRDRAARSPWVRSVPRGPAPQPRSHPHLDQDHNCGAGYLLAGLQRFH
jgi:hypothetical protein